MEERSLKQLGFCKEVSSSPFWVRGGEEEEEEEGR